MEGEFRPNFENLEVTLSNDGLIDKLTADFGVAAALTVKLIREMGADPNTATKATWTVSRGEKDGQLVIKRGRSKSKFTIEIMQMSILNKQTGEMVQGAYPTITRRHHEEGDCGLSDGRNASGHYLPPTGGSMGRDGGYFRGSKKKDPKY